MSALQCFLLNIFSVFMYRERNDIEFIQPVVEEPSRKPGRPAKTINADYLAEAMSARRHISVSSLARKIGVHRHTLRKQLVTRGLSKHYDNISDSDLDILTRAFKAKKPNSGLLYLIGFLRNNGIRVQKRRVMWSLQRVDGLGQILRRRSAIKRRKYSVPRPNYLWHCDGHHKLIWWGIVIHGFIDGYCRTVSLEFSNLF